VSASRSPSRGAAWYKTPALLLAAAGLLVATKSMFLVSAENGFWKYRFNLSLGFFYAFGFYVLLSHVSRPLLRNAVLLLAVFVAVRYAQADLLRQGVMLRGQIHDLALANRILTRIERLPDLDPSRAYTLVRTGYPNYRGERLLSQGHRFDRPGGSFDGSVVTGIRCPAEAMFLLGSRVQWKDRTYLKGWPQKIAEAREIARRQGRRPWPHESSVFIHGDWIIVYM